MKKADKEQPSRHDGALKFACYVGERHTRHTRPESGTHGMRGSKPAGFWESENHGTASTVHGILSGARAAAGL